MSALIVRDDSQLSVTITGEAAALKATAMDCAALVRKVENASQQENAVIAQTEIRRVLKLVEDSRVEAKAPILDFGRAIDTAAKSFIEDLKKEEIRISRLVGDFQTLELQKQRAAEAARVKELNEIERRTQEQLAQAKSHDEVDAIRERANEEAAALPVAAPVRSANQVVREEWTFTVEDLWLLARSHPTCVKIEPRTAEIKALLAAGVKVAGVKAWKEVKASVRLQREPQALEAA